MTLDEIIKLFEELEAGKQPAIGFHLHGSINKILTHHWRTNQEYPETFSGFLKALKDTEFPPELLK